MGKDVSPAAQKFLFTPLRSADVFLLHLCSNEASLPQFRTAPLTSLRTRAALRLRLSRVQCNVTLPSSATGGGRAPFFLARGPRKAARLFGERKSDEVSELSHLCGSE